MEQWELEFEWLKVRHEIKDRLERDVLPDLNAVLFLIGLQELGYLKEEYNKEEKQDLMHIAVCRLLSYDGHYEFAGRDADGWPHWRLVVPVQTRGAEEQERLLIEKIIRYFRELEEE
jgi:hypothetical protein